MIALSELPDFIKSECFQPSDHYNGSYECGEEDEDAYSKDFARQLAAEVILPSSIQNFTYVRKIKIHFYFCGKKLLPLSECRSESWNLFTQ